MLPRWVWTELLRCSSSPRMWGMSSPSLTAQLRTEGTCPAGQPGNVAGRALNWESPGWYPIFSSKSLCDLG